jgi:hypothetical protein
MVEGLRLPHRTTQVAVKHGKQGRIMHNSRTPQGTLEHHHWQGLAGLVVDVRPEWKVGDVMDKLLMCQDLQGYPDLARTALTVALDPASKSPASIHFAAAGLSR